VQLGPNALWQQKNQKRLEYNDKALSRDGIRKMQLTADVEGRAKMLMTARGVSLPMPAQATPFQFFVQDPRVTVQLLNDEGMCWTTDFTVPETTHNKAGRFKAQTR